MTGEQGQLLFPIYCMLRRLFGELEEGVSCFLFIDSCSCSSIEKAAGRAEAISCLTLRPWLLIPVYCYAFRFLLVLFAVCCNLLF